MTAEERAKAVFGELCSDWDNTPSAECEHIIADAIRAAEDEALDKAAQMVAGLPGLTDPYGWHADDAYEAAQASGAEAIRSLKSEGSK